MYRDDVLAWISNLPGEYTTYARPPESVGMTTDQEFAMVESYARDVFSGKGRIFDLGCWYGATTAAMARGLARNSRTDRRKIVDAVDTFIWEAWMDGHGDSLRVGRRPEHTSFLDAVHKRLAPYEGLVNLVQQDLSNYELDDEPVEFLFIDAMKSWSLANSIYTTFFPALLERNSVVVQQDFMWHHPLGATAHMMMWWLRENFLYLHRVPNSCSTVYFCEESVPATSFFSSELFTLDDIHSAYEYNFGCVGADAALPLRVAKVGYLSELGFYKSAARELELLELVVHDLSQLAPSAFADLKDWVSHTKLYQPTSALAGDESSEDNFAHLVSRLSASADRHAR